ncbi:hypothetical protein KO498_12150 [Lentibacter algarum]|uniref:hypothetical protein n=1 Tax=Lentibacter algarum TaxID=576131 RepID=UPI001C09B15D|nr:hypothetical protein [Lentibacter algarum]MBU2982562.1 hypothetical protein [Lentibacter algarum]
MFNVATSVHVPENAVEKYSVEALPPTRLFNVFAGAVLLLAALGLWAMPGAVWDNGLMLFKLMITIALMASGFAMIAPVRRRIPEVNLDPRSERLEVVVRNEFGRVVRSQVYEYKDLSEIDVRGGVFIARDHQGRSVVELPLGKRAREMDSLRSALGPSFARTG